MSCEARLCYEKTREGVNFINMISYAQLLQTQMLWRSTSISITFLYTTLLVHSTRGYTNFTKCCTPTGVNFFNVLRAAFALADPKCAKRHSSWQCRLALLGPTSVKAARKTLMKLRQGVWEFNCDSDDDKRTKKSLRCELYNVLNNGVRF